MSDPIGDDCDDDLASDLSVIELKNALLDGRCVQLWGEGESKHVGEPRLTLWLERGKIRLQGTGGVDLGAFGNGDVAWRFMQPILMEERKAEG